MFFLLVFRMDSYCFFVIPIELFFDTSSRFPGAKCQSPLLTIMSEPWVLIGCILELRHFDNTGSSQTAEKTCNCYSFQLFFSILLL